MSSPIDTKEIERRILWSYHQDGLLDIVVGLGILNFGLLMLTDNVALVGIFPALVVPLLMAAKSKITFPRIGYVNLGAERKSKYRMLLFLSVLVGLVFFMFFAGLAASDSLRSFLSEYFMFIFGGMVALMMAGAATQIGWRMFAYAGLTLLFFWGGEWLGFEPPIYVTVLGVLLTLAGLGVLIRFLRTHPLHDETM